MSASHPSPIRRAFTIAITLFSHRYSFSLLVFLHTFLLLAYLISDSFTGTGFDESVIYILLTGIRGFDLEGYFYLLASTLLLLLFALYFSFKLPSYLPAVSKKPVLLNATLLALVAAQPITANLVQHSSFYIRYGEQPTIEFEAKLTNGIILVEKPNIVYLYLEGFERSYLDEKLFPGLAPNLNRVESASLRFTNITEVYGTRWTIAGMVASQCGLPLEPVANANKSGTFMPKAYCLGDILHENGYFLSYLGGASLRFGGKGNFYSTHNFDSILGREQLLQQVPASTPVTEWGLYDEDIFALANQQLVQLKDQNQPFALFMLTLDTHPPDGFPSSSCAGIQYLDGSNAMLNAVHCSDLLVSRFVEKLQSDPKLANTLIIVGSDHLSRGHSASHLLEELPERRNLLFISGNRIEAGPNSRFASTLDIAPTILGLFTKDQIELNLGVDLQGDEKTILELSSEPDRDIQIWSRQLSDFY